MADNDCGDLEGLPGRSEANRWRADYNGVMTGPIPIPETRMGGSNDLAAWRLATESIVVRIRWFGVVVGYSAGRDASRAARSDGGSRDPGSGSDLRAAGLDFVPTRAGVSGSLAAFRLGDRGALYRTPVPLRRGPQESFRVVLPAVLDLRGDPVPAAGGLVDVRVRLLEPLRSDGGGGPGSRRGGDAAGDRGRSWPGRRGRPQPWRTC